MDLPMEESVALAEQGVFATIQGEGVLMGLPMIFVRLAGCSVGCANCDTEYKVHERLSPFELCERIASVWVNQKWLWLTGGEPTDRDLLPIMGAVRRCCPGLRIALATAGTRAVVSGRVRGGPDFVSVSPHDPGKWAMLSGDQLNLVPGLNGFRLKDFESVADACQDSFAHRFVTPCHGLPDTVEECLEWVRRKDGWRMGVQAHRMWGVA